MTAVPLTLGPDHRLAHLEIFLAEPLGLALWVESEALVRASGPPEPVSPNNAKMIMAPKPTQTQRSTVQKRS